MDRIPNARQVHIEIFRDDFLADTDHLGPRYFGVLTLEFDGQTRRGLTNDFDLAHNRVLNHAAREKFTLRHPARVALDLLYRVEDMTDQKAIATADG